MNDTQYAKAYSASCILVSEARVFCAKAARNAKRDGKRLWRRAVRRLGKMLERGAE